jgi:hypothetical protein
VVGSCKRVWQSYERNHSLKVSTISETHTNVEGSYHKLKEGPIHRPTPCEGPLRSCLSREDRTSSNLIWSRIYWSLVWALNSLGRMTSPCVEYVMSPTS